MGGYGSGRCFGRRGPTVGDYETVDIRQLRKEGYIGRVGTIVHWHVKRQRVEFVEGGVIVVFDRHGPSEHCVALETTPCNLGGERTWFCCPRCGGRTVELHLSGSKLACRHCHKLTYLSQRERAPDRARRRQRKIRALLGMGPNLIVPITEKPKGMRWVTFERLRARDLGSAGIAVADMVRVLDQCRRRVSIDPRAFQRREGK